MRCVLAYSILLLGFVIDKMHTEAKTSHYCIQNINLMDVNHMLVWSLNLAHQNTTMYRYQFLDRKAKAIEDSKANFDMGSYLSEWAKTKQALVCWQTNACAEFQHTIHWLVAWWCCG